MAIRPTLRSRRKVLILYSVYLMLLAALLAGGAEWIVRKRGWRPWSAEAYKAEVTPGGKFFQKDPVLGYTHIPGQYVVTLRGGYTFTATHLPNTLRATHPLTEDTTAAKPQIWIFGCSYTYGWSLNDEETYAWLVQEAFPRYEVVNFGVNGYAQIQALLRMRQFLEAGPAPRVAVVTYAGFHDARNSFLRVWRRALGTWNRLGPLVQPYARLDADGKLRIAYAPVEFVTLPFVTRSALANYIELKFEEFEARRERSHEVTRALILEMAALARERGFTLVIAGISEDEPAKDVVRFATENGLPAIDISADLTARGFRNIPHDRHPSALANREFASRLVAYLSTLLEDEESRPSGGHNIDIQ
jgi:hypothetical protein